MNRIPFVKHISSFPKDVNAKFKVLLLEGTGNYFFFSLHASLCFDLMSKEETRYPPLDAG